MSKNERIGDRYPIFDAYGGGRLDFLSTEDAEATTVECRIKSIWPFVVRRVLSFSATLKAREVANYDPEDILSEIWLKLAEKDSQWTSDRGKYITFAGVVIDHELHAIRDKARTVHAPRNSACRMKQYRDEADSGQISGRRAKTASDILRTRDGTFDLGSVTTGPGNEDGGPLLADGRVETPSEAMARKETSLRDVAAIRKIIKEVLTPFEALVVAFTAGIGPGRPGWAAWPGGFDVRWIAIWTKRSDRDVRRAKDGAVKKIRKHLAAIGHTEAH